MVSDYNAMVSVGGSKLWMTIDTSTSTTWVMSMACFTVGCSKVKIYAGAFIPALPPGPFPIVLLEAGLFQILSMVGINGHTMVNAGESAACPPLRLPRRARAWLGRRSSALPSVLDLLPLRAAAALLGPQVPL